MFFLQIHTYISIHELSTYTSLVGFHYTPPNINIIYISNKQLTTGTRYDDKKEKHILKHAI